MPIFSTPLFAMSYAEGFGIAAIVLAAIFGIVAMLIMFSYGSIWLQAYMSGADVSIISLVGMSLRDVKPSHIVGAKVMAYQAGLSIDRKSGISTDRLEAHFLAGGDIVKVVQAIIAARRAGIELDFDRAAAIDLAGRDVLDAVRTSVTPKIIDCPDRVISGKSTLTAVARNGVELLIRARVTVRMNLDQLIGGATEETIIARVGQGIISAIGSSDSHADVLAQPDRISKGVLTRGLDANTAFSIVSIDIATIDVGQNIGALLQTDQAEADMQLAKAQAEQRRADAAAWEQEMIAKVTHSHAMLILAQAEVPIALAEAFRRGQLYAKDGKERMILNISDARAKGGAA